MSEITPRPRRTAESLWLPGSLAVLRVRQSPVAANCNRAARAGGTLEAMAFTEADIDEFIALVQSNAGLRERVRRALVDDAFERIAATLAQSAEDDRRFREGMHEFRVTTEARFDAIDERFDRVDERFDRVDERFDRADRRMDGMDKRFDRIEGQLGNLRGEVYEIRFSLNPIRLTRHFRDVRPVFAGSYEPILDARDRELIGDADWEDLIRADTFALVRRRGDKTDIIAVIELSRVIDQGDVDRARRRAAILNAAGVPAVGCAAGEAATEGAIAAAGDDVLLVLDRRDPVEADALQV